MNEIPKELHNNLRRSLRCSMWLLSGLTVAILLLLTEEWIVKIADLLISVALGVKLYGHI